LRILGILQTIALFLRLKIDIFRDEMAFLRLKIDIFRDELAFSRLRKDTSRPGLPFSRLRRTSHPSLRGNTSPDTKEISAFCDPKRSARRKCCS